MLYFRSHTRIFSWIGIITSCCVAATSSAQGLQELVRSLKSINALLPPNMFEGVNRKGWDSRLVQKRVDSDRNKWWTQELKLAYLQAQLAHSSLEALPILALNSARSSQMGPFTTGTGLESEGVVSIPLPLESSLNLSTGNLNQRLELFSYPKRGGGYFSVSFYTNSAGVEVGGLGFGWKFGPEMTLNYVPGSAAFIRMEDGSLMPFEEGFSGRFQAPEGVQLGLIHNPDGTWNLTHKDQSTDRFDTQGRRTQTIDRNSNWVQYNWQGNLLSSIEDEVGRRTEIGYLGGLINSVTSPDGRIWNCSYTSNWLNRVLWPQIQKQRPYHQFGYNAYNQVDRIRNREGHTWALTFEQGRLTEARAPTPVNGLTQVDYFPYERVITFPEGQTTTYRFVDGYLAEVENAAGAETYLRNPDGSVHTHIDRRNKEWRYRWDERGNLLRKTDPKGIYEEWTYSPQNDVETHRDVAGGLVRYRYYPDGKGHVEYVQDQLNHLTYYTWTDFGSVETVSDHLGRTIIYEFDDYGYVKQMADPAGVTTKSKYNLVGVKEEATDSRGYTTYLHADPWQRLVGATYPDKHFQWREYDSENRLVSETNERSYTRRWEYDEAGRLKAYENQNGDREIYSYNRNNWLTSVRNGRGFTRSIQPNALGKPWIETLADGRQISYTYLPTGQLRTRTNAAGTVTYGYDDAGHLDLVDYPTGTDTRYLIDERNRRRTMVDASGTSIEQFDPAWRIISVQSPQGTVTTQFNEANQKVSRTQSGFGGTTLWNYDPASGRLEGLTNGHKETTSYGYDPVSGLQDTITYSDGLTKKFDYDVRGRVKSVQHFGRAANLIHSEETVYDPAGNVEFKTVDGVDTYYSYDQANQLLSEFSDYHQVAYTYDQNGNRETRSFLEEGDWITELYTNDRADKLLSVVSSKESTALTYDPAGRPTNIHSSGNGETLVSYDYDNQVTRIQYPGSTVSTFAYNGNGARIGKTDGEGTFSLLRDGLDVTSLVLADKANRSYTPGISLREGSSSTFQLGGLKDVSVQVGEDERERFRELRDAFGNVLSSSGTRAGIFGSGGQVGYQTDRSGPGEDSHLQNIGLRYYSQKWGRCLTEDPLRDGRNWFTYCANNPLGHYDRAGLEVGTLVLGGGALAAGGKLGTVVAVATGPVGMAVVATGLAIWGGYLLYQYYTSTTAATATAVAGTGVVMMSAEEIAKITQEIIDLWKELNDTLAKIAALVEEITAAIEAGDWSLVEFLTNLKDVYSKKLEELSKKIAELQKKLIQVQ